MFLDSAFCSHGMTPPSFGPCLSKGCRIPFPRRSSVLRLTWYYKLALRKDYSYALYIKKKSVSQRICSLQFKQSSLLVGFYNENIQKLRFCVLLYYFISILFRGLLHCVTIHIMQECYRFHSKSNPYPTWSSSQYRHLKGKEHDL